MPKLAIDQVPSYRLHKQSGQAIVTLNGRDFLLGPHGSDESRNAYSRRIAEWLANGRQLVEPASLPGARPLTVNDLYLSFQRYADQYYCRGDGSPTSEADNFRDAWRPVLRLYGNTQVARFGPLTLKAIQQEMIRLGWARTNINRQVNRVRHVFKWGVGQEQVPAAVYQALQTVEGLKRGRCQARESPPVRPVDPERLIRTLEHAPRILRTMIEVELLTGMRPGELCNMRRCDIDTSGTSWAYKLARHKTSHLGHERTVILGPRAQSLLQPFLERSPETYVFSPAEAEQERRERSRQRRVTPLSCGNRAGTNRKVRPKRRPGDHYTVESYNRAIARACDKAWPAPDGLTPTERDAWHCAHRWAPNQLRHAAATRIRREFGLEAAQVVLGHRTLTVTQVYAERHVAEARRVMEEVG
jgi:integrase